MARLTSLTCTLLLSLWLAPAMSAQRLDIQDPWVPEAPPGRMMAGFMSLHNATADEVVLVAVRAAGFGHAEIHDMVIDEEGVMRMRRLDQLTVPAGETVTLASGGYHVMLMQPQQRFAAGDAIELVFIDQDGGEHPALAQVRPR